MPAGRPREFDRAALYTAFEKYIEETDIPIIAEFSYMNGFGKGLMHEWDEFIDLLKRCTTKKEAALEQKALEGSVNTAMAIFSLKQLGWSDRQDITHKGDAAHPLAITNADGKL